MSGLWSMPVTRQPRRSTSSAATAAVPGGDVEHVVAGSDGQAVDQEALPAGVLAQAEHRGAPLVAVGEPGEEPERDPLGGAGES